MACPCLVLFVHRTERSGGGGDNRSSLELGDDSIPQALHPFWTSGERGHEWVTWCPGQEDTAGGWLRIGGGNHVVHCHQRWLKSVSFPPAKERVRIGIRSRSPFFPFTANEVEGEWMTFADCNRPVPVYDCRYKDVNIIWSDELLWKR